MLEILFYIDFTIKLKQLLDNVTKHVTHNFIAAGKHRVVSNKLGAPCSSRLRADYRLQTKYCILNTSFSS